jgi:effector-binding domain-containing protein
MGRAFGTVAAELGTAHHTPDGPAIASYEPTEDGFDVAAGFRVPPSLTVPPGLDRLELCEVEAAHTTHIGPYTELPVAYEDLRTQAEAVHRTLAGNGPMWEEYWSEPGMPEDQTRTEIYWALGPASQHSDAPRPGRGA